MKNPTRAREAYQYPLLIKSILANGLAAAPTQEIVSGDLCRYTYQDLDIRVKKLANALTLLGIMEDQTVAVMDWDSHRYLECFFAIPMIGATIHMINVRLSPEQILYTINHAGDDAILVHEDFLPLFKRIADRIETKPVLVVLRNSKGQNAIPEGFTAEYEAMMSDAGTNFVFPELDEGAIATTFYSTGTTGDPKGVYFSHRQIVLHTMGSLVSFGTIGDAFRLHSRDVYMPLTPLFHVHAWGFPYCATMLGLKQVYPGRYVPQRIVALLKNEGVTFSHCVPTILRMVLGHPNAREADLSKLKMVIGGSAMTESFVQLVQEFGIQVFNGYGMSEACPLLTLADMTDFGPEDVSAEANLARIKTGNSAVLVEVRVVDEQMNDVPRDGKSTGEVVARGPWLTQGYSKDQDGSDFLWRNGYLHTGDIGYLDDGGALRITDRIKDVIKSGGEWISSLELENICSVCTLVREVAVIGVPDVKWGELPVAVVVVTKDGSAEDCKIQIQDALLKAIEDGKLPKLAKTERIEIVNSIPKSSVGKTDKKLLRQMYGS